MQIRVQSELSSSASPSSLSGQEEDARLDSIDKLPENLVKDNVSAKDEDERTNYHQKQQSAPNYPKSGSSSDESESSSSSSSPLIKPLQTTYVPKSLRLGALKTENENEFDSSTAKNARVEESRLLALQMSIYEQIALQKHAAQSREWEEILTSSDEVDSVEERLEWVQRERERINQCYRKEKMKELELKEIEKNRLREDSQVQKELEEQKALEEKEMQDAQPDEFGHIKGKMKFMQKYYHKGAFFKDVQENDSVFQRDFTAPTLIDREVDKSQLPKPMQVKNFGMKGNTKYTHLADQDTSRVELYDRQIYVPVKRQLAGTGSVQSNKRQKP